MPSASSKSSQPTQPAPTQNLLQEPFKNALLVADKKLRNLEKRRLKILETKKKADQGAELNEDQKKALENLCSVDNSLEAVKDVKKNLTTLETEYNKLQKKEQRKKKQEQREYDEGRNLQTLMNTVEIQGILGELSDEVRPDFLAGTNNACELSEKDLENLDTIYDMINPAAAEGKDVKLSARVKTASEHLMCIVDARAKPAFDEVTYKDINEILTKIKNSGYFDKDLSNGDEEPVETPEEAPEAVPEEQSPEQEVQDESPEEEYPPSNFQEEPEVAQPVPVNGVDLPPEVQEQETPENEKIDFLGESEISSAIAEAPALNPVSPEFVPRNLQGGQGENGRSDSENWQQVEGGQNQHHGNGGYRGRGGRGNRGFGRGGRGGRGNYRGGPRDGNFRGNRGGGRGGRGGNRDGDNYRGNRDDNYRGNRDGGSYRGNRDGSRGGNRGRGSRGGSGAPPNGGFGQPN